MLGTFLIAPLQVLTILSVMASVRVIARMYGELSDASKEARSISFFPGTTRDPQQRSAGLLRRLSRPLTRICADITGCQRRRGRLAAGKRAQAAQWATSDWSAGMDLPISKCPSHGSRSRTANFNGRRKKISHQVKGARGWVQVGSTSPASPLVCCEERPVKAVKATSARAGDSDDGAKNDTNGAEGLWGRRNARGGERHGAPGAKDHSLCLPREPVGIPTGFIPLAARRPTSGRDCANGRA